MSSDEIELRTIAGHIIKHHRFIGVQLVKAERCLMGGDVSGFVYATFDDHEDIEKFTKLIHDATLGIYGKPASVIHYVPLKRMRVMYSLEEQRSNEPKDVRGPAVIVTGSVLSGFSFYGPCESVDAAVAVLERRMIPEHATVVLVKPLDKLPFFSESGK